MYYPSDFPARCKPEFFKWRKSNPGGTPKAWMTAFPDRFKEAIVEEVTGGDGEVKEGGKNVSAPGLHKQVIPKRYKSPELKEFERVQKLNAGEGRFNLYRRNMGGWSWVHEIDRASREAIAEEFGGGRFLVRRIDPNTDEDMPGPENSTVFTIDEGVYPSMLPAPRSVYRPLKSHEEEITDAEVVDAKFTTEDLKEAEAKAAKDAEMKLTIAQLQAKAFAPETPKEDRLDTLTKLVELQKVLAPPPAIGEAKSMTDTITGIAGAITAAWGAWQQVKQIFPQPEAPASGGIVDRLFGTLAEKVATQVMTAKAEPAGPAQDAPAIGAPKEDHSKMLDGMMDELAMEIAKQQEVESSTGKDTVAPMVTWILEQKGMAWDILRVQAKSNETSKVVAFIGGKRPTLLDTDFKRKWVENVVEVLKAPEAIGK